MINVHLNGDVVSCADHNRTHEEVCRIRLDHGLCPLNCFEKSCQTWLNKKFIEGLSGRCNLFLNYSSQKIEGFEWKKYECPEKQKQYINGLKPKRYNIASSNYRKLSSAAYSLVKTSKFKTLFITLTFPKFKKQTNGKELNQYFSKFVENLRSHYEAAGYVAVRERGDVNNRYHFHLLLSIPFIPFVTLNDIWCRTISPICEFSRCAVRTTKKNRFINNPGYALRYVCKYFTKARGSTSKSRVIFISNNLIRKPKRLEYYQSDLITFFEGYKSVKICQSNEYATTFRIWDYKEFDVFTERVLNKLFNLTKNNNDLFCPGAG